MSRGIFGVVADKIKEKRAVKQSMDDKKEFVDSIYSLFEEYRSAYAAEWERLETCERMYRGEHWHGVEAKDNEPQPVTPIIQSTIENVHADLMDAIPEAVITAEDTGDPQNERTAKVIEAIVKQNADAASYAREYWAMTHDLITAGYMVQEVGYDTTLNKGLGGAFKRHVDPRGFMVDPLVINLQGSRAVFKYAAKPIPWMEQHYPQYKGQFKADTKSALPHDGSISRDDTKNVLLIECWQREFDPQTNRYKVHMCHVGGHILLEDSRDKKPGGYYEHGEYPFVVTPLFMRKGSCLGYGFVDMFDSQQKYSDKLDQIVMKNALMASKNKMLVTTSSGFDADDLRDWSREVHEGEHLAGITWFQTPPLPPYIIQYIQGIRQSIKDESGANDFSRGNTSSGVTAASAIAALQEMSTKRSRMATRQAHEAFKDATRMEIEVEREYNVLPREVVITINGQKERETFDTSLLERETANGNKIPIEFAISIKVQRENRWNVMAHNELIIQMVQLGVLQPAQALELMQFDGREAVLAKQQQQPAQLAPEEQQARQEQAAQMEMVQQLQQIPAPEMALG